MLYGRVKVRVEKRLRVQQHEEILGKAFRGVLRVVVVVRIWMKGLVGAKGPRDMLEAFLYHV